VGGASSTSIDDTAALSTAVTSTEKGSPATTGSAPTSTVTTGGFHPDGGAGMHPAATVATSTATPIST
jgi:hypothetical protein